MKTFWTLTKRNVKLFFKDKGLFFSSLITPLILLILYSTFLANVYREAFVENKNGMEISEKLIDGMVAGELISSLLAVSCITVAFCSNLLMIQDKVSGAKKDFLVSPVKESTVSISYFAATFLSTIIVSLTAAAACLIYVAVKGWFMSFADVLLLIADVFLLTLFGTALSSFINGFLSTNGQASAVGTIVSAGYGFLCGAYMPIASFGKWLQKVIMFMPGTYGTSLIRNHAMRGTFEELAGLIPNAAVADDVVTKIKDGVDCNIYFFGNNVEPWVMYLILIGSTLLILGAYVVASILMKKGKK